MPEASVTVEAFGEGDGASPVTLPDGATSVQTAPNEARINQEPTTESTTETPAGLPAKFKTVDDLAKAYTELEKKLGSRTTEQAPAAPAATTTEGLKLPEAQANLSFEKYNKEIMSGKDLSPESYAELAKAGIPKAVAITHVKGIIALQQQSTERIFSEVGGRDKYTEMVKWASSNLSKGEQDAFNRAVIVSEESARLAIAGVKARYEAVEGKAPRLVAGSGAANLGDRYEDHSQMMDDMSKPEYKKSQAFRDKVSAKLARSSIFQNKG